MLLVRAPIDVQAVMAVQRGLSAIEMIDVLDRVLDKGIVLDACLRLCEEGIDLRTVKTQISIESLRTFLNDPEVLDTILSQWFSHDVDRQEKHHH